MKENYFLQFEPLSKIFYVADSVIKGCIDNQKVPMLELSAADYERLGVSAPSDDAPLVGFLMGRSGDAYSVDWNYLWAIVHAFAKVKAFAGTGVRLRFLTYYHCSVQLEDCLGLVLPGGAFASSELYYTDPRNDEKYASLRQMAYDVSIRVALDEGISILGICAGAQMVAGAFGLKMYRSFDYVETPIQHKTNKPEAHRLNVFPGTPLQKIFGDENLFFVNSRHNELLVPIKVQRELWAEAHHNFPQSAVAPLPLDMYAEANDGTPEAWGAVDKHVLCVQWHPEDMAVAGDKKMLDIYKWLAEEIQSRLNLKQHIAEQVV